MAGAMLAVTLASALLGASSATAVTGPSLSDLLGCHEYRDAVGALSALPLLHQTYSAVLPPKSETATFGELPTHGLMDEANCLLRALTDSASQHVLEAIALPHPRANPPSALEAPELVSVTSNLASSILQGADVHADRLAIAAVLERAAALARAPSARIHEVMPHSVRHVAGSLNVAFIAAMAASIAYPDVTLAECFLHGFPIVGYVPASACPAFREVPRPLDPPGIRHLDNHAANLALARRVESDFREGRSPHAQALWDSTIEEVTKGYSLGPFSTHDLDSRFGRGQWRAMLAFAVAQLRQDGTVKLRRCDDAAASLHNECTSLGETITCDSADFPARAAALFAQHLGPSGWTMQGGTEDIEMAYRRCPSRTPQYTVVCLVDPATGLARFFFLPGMNFGLASAVNQFNRLPELIVTFLRRRCGVVVTHYFDDYCVAEPRAAGLSGQHLLRLIHRLVGMPLAKAKSVPMSIEFNFLGVVTDFRAMAHTGRVHMRPKPGRAASVVATIAAVLAAGFISHAAAATLRGKLQFLLYTAGAGSRAVRSTLYLLSAVRRGRTRSRVIPMAASLRAALRFIEAVVGHLPPRTVDIQGLSRSSASEPIIVWSDAMWADGVGGLGFVVYFPPSHPRGGPDGTFSYAHRQVRAADLPFLSRDDHLIGQLELLAGASVYASYPASDFAGWDVVHYIDNTSALYSLSKGYSAQPDSLLIIRAFLALDLAIGANIWFNYVATKANVADLPSRGAIGEMESCIQEVHPTFRAHGSSVPFVVPAIPSGDASISALWAAVAAAAFPPQPLRRHSRPAKRRRAHS